MLWTYIQGIYSYYQFMPLVCCQQTIHHLCLCDLLHKDDFFSFSFFFLSYSLWGLPTLACKPLCAKGNPRCATNNPLCANANAKYLDLQHCTLWIILSFNGTVARCVPDVGPRWLWQHHWYQTALGQGKPFPTRDKTMFSNKTQTSTECPIEE